MKYLASDYLYLLLRTCIVLTLMYFLGFIYGLISYFLFNFVRALFLQYAFGLVALSPVDELFIYDNENNLANICCIKVFKLMICI
jgi:hypothetical protein